MKTIQSTVLNIKNKSDKNKQNYLILELTKQENILVFANQVNPDKWDDFETSGKYQFTIKKGRNDSNILVSYKKLGRVTDILDEIYDSSQYVTYQTPQEFLNDIYSHKNWVELISFDENLSFDQAGELVIDNYPNLQRINSHENFNITKLTISNCPQLEIVGVDNFNLQQLILDNLPKLNWLDCDKNNLTTLDLTNCPNLQRIGCSSNKLMQIKLPKGEKLEYLDLKNNNFNQDLSFLKDLTNLKELNLGSSFSLYDDVKNNRFRGNLEFLKNLNELWSLDISDTDIDSGLEYLSESVEKFNCSVDYRKDAKVKAIYDLFADEKGEVETEYGGIKNFPQKLKKYKQWIKLSFSEEEIKKWKEIGLKLDEYYFADYLKNVKKLNPQIKKNNDLDKLRKDIEYKTFLSAKQSEKTINQFIQEANLTKIPYEQLDNIEYLTEGGFGKIYQAEWEDKNVILKSLNNSQELTPEFLQEIASHDLFGDSGKIVKCHGISQNPKSKEYVMVMEYIRGGNLRQYLQKNNNKLDLKKKLIQLSSIAEGLKDIHEKGLTHKDFHSGNILSKGEGVFFEDLICRITDLGLCKPANDANTENIYGVMPYVAPEVLRNKPYTQASDIYSFGVVAYEVLSGLPPHGNRNHDISLALEICGKENLRPQFKIKIPQLLEDLIKRCWEDNPLQRPTANELSKTLNTWYQEVIKSKQDTEFTQQVKETEEFNQNLLGEIKYLDVKEKKSSKGIYHSRLLPTKEIVQLLSRSQSEQIYEQAISRQILKQNSDLESCAIISAEQELGQQIQEINNSPKNNEESTFITIKASELEKLKQRIVSLEKQVVELENQQQTQIIQQSHDNR